MENNNNNKTNGAMIGICDLLLVAFIILKLCGVITWSWLWVLAPAWIPLAIIGVILIIVAIVYLVRER